MPAPSPLSDLRDCLDEIDRKYRSELNSLEAKVTALKKSPEYLKWVNPGYGWYLKGMKKQLMEMNERGDREMEERERAEKVAEERTKEKEGEEEPKQDGAQEDRAREERRAGKRRIDSGHADDPAETVDLSDPAESSRDGGKRQCTLYWHHVRPTPLFPDIGNLRKPTLCIHTQIPPSLNYILPPPSNTNTNTTTNTALATIDYTPTAPNNPGERDRETDQRADLVRLGESARESGVREDINASHDVRTHLVFPNPQN